ncbi:MAG: hypothetical protein AABX08_02350, partial [Nanoarchaeota archaeon]
MEQNNKILIMAVIVLLVGVVAFNFNTISGAQTKDVTSVRVSPSSGVCDLSSGYGQGRVSFYLDISGKAPDSKVLIYE